MGKPRARSASGARLFLKSWRIELISLLLLGLGLFLIFERFQIRASIGKALLFVGAFIRTVIAAVLAIIDDIDISDALGLGLLAVAIVLLFLRIGHRMRISPAWSSSQCPSCGLPKLERLRRRGIDIATWMLPLRRYVCRNCGWQGLRARRYHGAHGASPEL